MTFGDYTQKLYKSRFYSQFASGMVQWTTNRIKCNGRLVPMSSPPAVRLQCRLYIIGDWKSLKAKGSFSVIHWVWTITLRIIITTPRKTVNMVIIPYRLSRTRVSALQSHSMVTKLSEIFFWLPLIWRLSLCYRFLALQSLQQIYASVEQRWCLIAVVSESPDSSVGIATGYGLDGWGSNPGRGKRCFSSAQHPDRLWDPASLLYYGYWGGGFPWG
jgi:hypothetical protein